MTLPVVVALTGASGALYGVRLLEVLLQNGLNVQLVISPSAVEVFAQELETQIDLARFDPAQLCGTRASLLRELIRSAAPNHWQTPPLSTGAFGRLTYHRYHDYSAGIASGSYQTAGMVICPCSMGSLAAIAGGLSTNLIQRAADVHLKERRTLIVVPRETPLGSIQLENMKRLVDAGAVVLPAMPGFYHRPQTIDELVDFIVARICDHLKLGISLAPRWGTAS